MLAAATVEGLLVVGVIWALLLIAAAQNGQWLWFALGLILPPLALVGAVLPPKPGSSSGRKRYRQCPACAEYVKKQATVCRYCGTQLEPAGRITVPPRDPT